MLEPGDLGEHLGALVGGLAEDVALAGEDQVLRRHIRVCGELRIQSKPPLDDGLYGLHLIRRELRELSEQLARGDSQ